MLTLERRAAPVQLFRAFTDLTRVRILCLLADGEMCVGDLVAVLGLAQPKASRHLASLRQAGLVRVRKSGLWSFYSLATPRSDLHEKLLECLPCFADTPDFRSDRRKSRKLKRSGGCCPGEACR